jgi:hypothetical protein
MPKARLRAERNREIDRGRDRRLRKIPTPCAHFRIHAKDVLIVQTIHASSVALSFEISQTKKETMLLNQMATGWLRP